MTQPTGFMGAGRCYATVEEARAANCQALNSVVEHDGKASVFLCMSGTGATNTAFNLYSVNSTGGTAFIRQIVPPHAQTPTCSLEQPEIFPLPSATDIGTVFAWGFSLVLVSYLTAWGLGTVLNFLKRN
jgi:hypothetical protein